MAHKETGLPFADGLENCVDLPHTYTQAIAVYIHNRSIYEIPKDKRPPRGIWDKPFRLEQYIDSMYETKGSGTVSYDLKNEDVE